MQPLLSLHLKQCLKCKLTPLGISAVISFPSFLSLLSESPVYLYKNRRYCISCEAALETCNSGIQKCWEHVSSARPSSCPALNPNASVLVTPFYPPFNIRNSEVRRQIFLPSVLYLLFSVFSIAFTSCYIEILAAVWAQAFAIRPAKNLHWIAQNHLLPYILI